VDRKWWTLIVVSIATFMLLLDVTIVNVALPAIERDLHADFADLQWVIDAYALTLAALLLTGGSLADIMGRRRIFVVGIGIFTARRCCAAWPVPRPCSISPAGSRASARRSCSPRRWRCSPPPTRARPRHGVRASGAR
jgi:MFS family permease